MAAGPTKAQINYHMGKARFRAKAYADKYGVKCDVRLQRASNGEAFIFYDDDK